MAKLFVVLAAILAVCAANSIRERRQVDSVVSCPQTDGPIPDPSDCSFFFQCHAGRASRVKCVDGLEFNSQNNQCDYPANLANPRCQRVSNRIEVDIVCQGLNPNDRAAHPQYCNAFMYCQRGLLLDGCTFCAQGEYFDGTSRTCVATFNVDTVRACNGRQMVEPANQAVSRLDATCNPRNPNVFAELIREIQSGRFRFGQPN